jgi:hypothetical protein
MEAEEEDDEDGSAGTVAPVAGSERGRASGGGGDCGWEGETRGRSGGTEKGSKRAALVGRKSD